jgi:hypothetical protein
MTSTQFPSMTQILMVTIVTTGQWQYYFTESIRSFSTQTSYISSLSIRIAWRHVTQFRGKLGEDYTFSIPTIPTQTAIIKLNNVP